MTVDLNGIQHVTLWTLWPFCNFNANY